MIIQDTTADHHRQVGPWAQEEQGLLPGAGQECQEPPDWLPGRPRPHHHLKLTNIIKTNFYFTICMKLKTSMYIN